MAKEIEHKYLTVSGSYRDMQSSETRICQGYLSREPERTVRVRVADDRGFLTVKGENDGDSREEFESSFGCRNLAGDVHSSCD